MNTFFYYSFFSTPFVYACAFIIVSVTLILVTQITAKKAQKLRDQLIRPNHYKLLLSAFSFKKNTLKNIFLILGILSLCGALLRPYWGIEKRERTQKTRDLLLALDVSRSMLAQDLTPSRLEVAKQAIKDLTQSLAVDRVGLIIFSGSALVQCPLTTDKRAFYAFLDAIDSKIVASSSTALDAPIKEALKIFSTMSEHQHKLLAVFTDGEDFSGLVSSLKTEIQASGVHIFTIGMATPQGAPVPQIDIQGAQIGYEKDTQGQVVMSRLNSGILQLLATDSHGIFIPFTNIQETTHQLVKTIEQYEKKDFQETVTEQRIERYAYCAASALFFLLLEWIL